VIKITAKISNFILVLGQKFKVKP
jgi:hypothetical protein